MFAPSSVYEKRILLTKPFKASQSWHQLSVYESKIHNGTFATFTYLSLRQLGWLIVNLITRWQYPLKWIKVHSLCKQWLHKCFVFLNWQLMSALASLERFGEEYLVFINWSLCRHCLQNEWPLESVQDT